MKGRIVQSQGGITLVGGAPVSPALFRMAIQRAPRIVAADGGADRCLAHGAQPEAVIGDMDSVSPRARSVIGPERFHLIAEQDSTDFDKALRSISAPLIIGIGFLGGQVDHLLAAMTVLARYPDRAIVLVGQHDVVAHLPPQIDLPLSAGTRVSLYPMRPVRGMSTGLHWPIDGLELSPGGRVGTSNKADGPISLVVEGTGLLIILPVSEWRALQHALLQADGLWPAL